MKAIAKAVQKARARVNLKEDPSPKEKETQREKTNRISTLTPKVSFLHKTTKCQKTALTLPRQVLVLKPMLNSLAGSGGEGELLA